MRDEVKIVRRVTGLVEDNVRIEGRARVAKKMTCQEVSFETCVQVVIAEDSLETSFVQTKDAIMSNRSIDRKPAFIVEESKEPALPVCKMEDGGGMAR